MGSVDLHRGEGGGRDGEENQGGGAETHGDHLSRFIAQSRRVRGVEI
jgi:hypothetical protein